MELKFSKVRDVKDPKYSTDGAAGLDLYVPNDLSPIFIKPNSSTLIPSGLKFNIPSGFTMIAFNKSGIAAKKKLVVGSCVIDSDYEGEIFINLNNIGTEEQEILPGDKIIQFITIPVFQAKLTETHIDDLFPIKSKRGESGFGSTDRI